MRKLGKRIRDNENAFSVERYDSCISSAQFLCDPECYLNGHSEPYAMALVRENVWENIKV